MRADDVAGITSSKATIIFIVRTAIKLFGNLTKLLSYGVHFLAPDMRFTLPSYSPPLTTPSGEAKIPRVIWQTNFTAQVTLPLYLNYLFNRLMAPEYAYRFMVTADRNDFIKNNFDHSTYDLYSRIQIGAAQADFWRLLVLYRLGGVYMDIDAHLVWPLEKILSGHTKELYLKIKTGEISNYFIASVPDTENMHDLIERVCANIESGASENVYDLTGPGVFNDVFKGRDVSTRYYLYTCNQGNFTNEYFQYLDKPQGKWTKEQQKIDVVRRD